MKNKNVILMLLVALSLLSTIFIKKRTYKKYVLSTILINLFTFVLDRYGLRKNWWNLYKSIPPFYRMDFLNIGPYFASGLWMLTLTYGNLPLYIISNVSFTFCLLSLDYDTQKNIISYL